MNYQLIGDNMQALMVNLNPGEEMIAEAGAMLFCNDAIHFDAKMQGGLLGGLKRVVMGESLFLTHFNSIAPTPLQSLRSAITLRSREISIFLPHQR